MLGLGVTLHSSIMRGPNGVHSAARSLNLKPEISYHVKVVPHTATKGLDYLTLSIKGVTHTSAEGLQVQFSI